MKILAIRGCNLASLAGEFEIDLAHGALASAGVFAIVGPTGAGKSTLLDAMCVALFDRTPRLTNHSRVVVGRGADDPTALGAQDVRTLLRRGAAAGWAEVDFESGDARRYRARWSVRRARGATDGRFQSQQVSLTAIDGGQQLGGTKTETLEAIHQRLGLSFDQFRRSALLAQGEFAAFLRADGKDRSELLERMTGTEIYSQLSVRAHVKAALAEQRLRERQGAALAIAVLSDEARAEAERDLALAKQAQDASRVRLAQAEAAARWLAEAERRQRALAEAEVARHAAEQAVEAAGSPRAELALRRRAEALRPRWDAAARVERQLAVARGEAVAASEAALRAETEQHEIAARRTRLAELHAPIREARIAAGLVERPRGAGGNAKERADALDEVPAGRRGTGSSARGLGGELDEAPAGRRGTGSSARDVAAGLENRAVAASEDAAWLSARRMLAPAIAAWRELDARLAQQAAVAAEIATCDRGLADHARRRERLVGQRAHAANEHQQANGRLLEAQRDAATFQQRRGLSLDGARRQEDEARKQVADFERLLALTGEARGAATAGAELDRQLAELDQAVRADAKQRRRAEAERDAAALLRDERARVVDELRKAAGYAHARTELVDDEPCPLCGATEHPWRDRGSFDALIGDAQAKLAEAVARGEAALAALATVAAREAHRATERARLVACRTTARGSTQATRQRWREHLATLGELLFIEDPASAEAQQLADERALAARGKLEAARAARSQAEASAKASADAQARVQARQSDVEHHAMKLRELDAAIASVDAAAERLRGERVGKLDRQAELLAAIGDGLARWSAAALTPAQQQALADAHRVVAELDSGARVAAAPNRRADLAAEAIVAATPHRASALPADAIAPSEPRRASALPADALALLERCRRVLAELAAAWAAHAQVVAELDAALADVLGGIDEVARAAERMVAEQRARRDAAERRRDVLQAELADAAARLAADREAAGFDVDELRELLAAEPGRVDALAAHLDALDRAVDRARTLVGERRRLVEDHAATRPHAAMDPAERAGGDLAHAADAPPPPETIARATDAPPQPETIAQGDAALLADAGQLEALAAAVAAADHQAAALAAALAADGDARARRAAALAQLASAEHEAEIDRVLGQVIGSHDGKLFRSFAQSLTLDGLLAVANSHLEELAPRYQLARVPKHDLELQVIDRDLGDEIRSVQTLSGGESFLVSLALALGLSSMSAHDVRVRTLLIDEGFGTLDPATLDSALAVLDALQATGRQVGVISHVPALVERVGAHVRVSPKGGGRSEVVVAEA